jgi:hypothetical protein
MSTGENELERLRAENARLVSLLEANGVEWRLPPASAPQVQVEPKGQRLSTAEKLVLFRQLFRGRDDLYAVRWESKATGKSGYAPACANEWRPGICEKPRIKCSDCGHRKLSLLTDAVLYAQLRIIDIVDTGHPALLRMWEKRQRGYRAMGYRIAADVDREAAPARPL